MVKSYCVKRKKQTENVKNLWVTKLPKMGDMFWCTCAECGIKKFKFVKKGN